MLEEYKEYIEILKQDKSENTISTYGRSIELFLSFNKIETLEDVKKLTPKCILSFQNYILSRGNGKSTVNTHIRNLKAFFTFLKKYEYVDKNIMSGVTELKLPKRLPVYLEEWEQTAMLNACKNIQEKLMIAIMLTTGVRRNELVHIKVTDINEDEITIIGKGDKERNVYIPPNVVELLHEYLKNHKGEYLFHAQGKWGILSGQAVCDRIDSIMKDAGFDAKRIDEISPHKLRHTCATNLVDQGNSIQVIQHILGHSNPTTTLIYAHVKDKTTRKAMVNQNINL